MNEHKTPIKPGDIRKDDLIRWEADANYGGQNRAIEYRACKDGDQTFAAGQYYLLDRPTPAVELPTEPTLGWVAWEERGFFGGARRRAFGTWRADSDVVRDLDQHGRAVRADSVTAFTPAIAVPRDAYEALASTSTSDLDALRRAVHAFLDATDKANGSKP